MISALHPMTAPHALSSLTGVGDFTVTSVSYRTIAPVLVVFAGALVGVIVEAFVGRARRH